VVPLDFDHMDTRYEAAIGLLGKRWTGLMVRILMGGKRRFTEFKQQMPEISDRLLSERLKELEDREIITRHVYNTKPVLIEYELTAKGLALEPVVEAIQNWGDVWIDA